MFRAAAATGVDGKAPSAADDEARRPLAAHRIARSHFTALKHFEAPVEMPSFCRASDRCDGHGDQDDAPTLSARRATALTLSAIYRHTAHSRINGSILSATRPLRRRRAHLLPRPISRRALHITVDLAGFAFHARLRHDLSLQAFDYLFCSASRRHRFETMSMMMMPGPLVADDQADGVSVRRCR